MRKAKFQGFTPLHPESPGLQAEDELRIKFESTAKPRRRGVTGFTLIEVLLAVAILTFGLCAILATYISSVVLTATSKNINIATDAALGLSEEIRGSPFSRICSCDCDDPGCAGCDYCNELNFVVNDIPASRGIVYINDTNPELLNVTISISWRQGNRIIGEDRDLDGVLDAGEDDNHNGILDSPVELVTRIANR